MMLDWAHLNSSLQLYRAHQESFADNTDQKVQVFKQLSQLLETENRREWPAKWYKLDTRAAQDSSVEWHDDDHQLHNDTYPVSEYTDGKILLKDVPALTAINMRLRDDYSRDAAGGVKRWNAIIKKAGIDFALELPHEGFHRKIGVFKDAPITPEGTVISPDEWAQRRDEWLPPKADGDFIQSLMAPVHTPGEYAGWIAPPRVGIDNKPGDYEYVKLYMA